MARHLDTVSEKFPQREILVEAASFALVVSACVAIIFVASQTMPSNGWLVDVVARAVLSTTLALPCGASWRALRSAIRRKEQLARRGAGEMRRTTQVEG